MCASSFRSPVLLDADTVPPANPVATHQNYATDVQTDEYICNESEFYLATELENPTNYTHCYNHITQATKPESKL